VSLTEALRAGAPEVFGVLYDEHAGQLYAYCHIMVGDEEAAEAVRDAFIAAARHPATVRDDAALPVWLHALARAECVRRGALLRKPAPVTDPLRRTLAKLRPEHREALALSSVLAPAEVAQVIGVATDTAEMLVRIARRRLEQAAASVLGTIRDESMLAALGGGTLHTLVMDGYTPPDRLREQILFSCAAAERAPDGALLFDQDGMPIQLDALYSGGAEEPTRPMSKIVDSVPGGSSEPGSREPGSRASADGPRVSAGRAKKEPFLVRRRDGLVEVAGLAACVAAATGVLALWPTPHGGGASTVNGTSLLLHRGAQASRTVRPPATGAPEQAATAKSAPSPSGTPTGGTPRPTTPATTAPARPSTGPAPAHPSPTPSTSPTKTPTPTPTPTDSAPSDGSSSPTPDPSPS
jgi:DNA-directed RNA polymerase specialized sigma24 family protein